MKELMVVTGIDVLERDNRLTELQFFHITQEELRDAPDDTSEFSDIERASIPYGASPNQVRFLRDQLTQRLRDLGEE